MGKTGQDATERARCRAKEISMAGVRKESCRDADSTREKRRKVRNKLHKYQDAGSCGRLVEMLKIEK